uniref:Mitochondrial carrier protein n=1 Tax=Paramoeba aestuarina TaxID=180227 RepID=A0A7S4PJJ9_9EUKA|mmetsp:Transcript_7574/g.11404  ORF Transcript_7574/g.11404 Transcript_7574/m.11404 type:complete len:286 (+) Transcript_7574:61-918(+)|eukprot:CAMPEP_0201506906 /NCGR_PEP_ID=MMETSP0161_2-20130828/738_1 /ASSEMBLY_ACC=CAM_ASM_000251 /TAXON_ID=180227 /ORGANISM="Neoparamoeba aestuarina, Strain SoJaBio B1-5/56/2" /LENGTH=285 /DNA_ID=CAMNT_0047901145 /DNA_START=23 /DNA_END=880 /DNA_ORIENTATION=+
MADEKQLKPLPRGVEFPSRLAAGAVAGVIGVSLTFPLDFSKTRLQKQTHGEYKGIVDCLTKVYRQGGAKAWYSGMRVNLIGIIPEKAIKLACNDQFRSMLRDEETGKVSNAGELLAGAGAGFCQVVVTTPMEIVKIRGQLTGASIGQVISELGFMGLYKGYTPTLIRDVWFSVFFFPMQARMKETWIHPDDSPSAQTSKSFASGILAGSFAAAISTPFDVIKTRIQAGVPGGVVEVAKETMTKEGTSALFRGVIPRTAAIGPLFGVAIMVYDVQKRFIRFLGYEA